MALTTYITTSNSFSQWASKINEVIDLLDHYNTAASISFVPTGNIASITVQSAIVELQNELYSTTDILATNIATVNTNITNNVNAINANIANLSAALSANVTTINTSITNNVNTRLAKVADLGDINNAANARINIGLGSVATRNVATVSELLAWSGSNPITVDILQQSAQINPIAGFGTVTLNLNNGINFWTTLTGNISFANPSNIKVGQSGTITLFQDGTGNRAASWGSLFKWESGIVPSLTTNAGACDVFTYFCLASDRIIMSLVRDAR